MERSDWCHSHSGGATFCCIEFPQTLFLRVLGSGAARLLSSYHTALLRVENTVESGVKCILFVNHCQLCQVRALQTHYAINPFTIENTEWHCVAIASRQAICTASGQLQKLLCIAI